MKYFAYGANINKESMLIRCPQAVALKPVALRGWDLKFYSHANIEPKRKAVVHGVLWDLTEECIESLDLFEGFPVYYKRRNWQQDGDRFFFYEMNMFRKGTPSRSYVSDIMEGYKQWGLPTASLNYERIFNEEKNQCDSRYSHYCFW